MARYYTNFNEESIGDVTPTQHPSANWEVVSNVTGRTNRFESTAPGGQKLVITAGANNGASLIGYKATKNYPNSGTLESLVQFSVDTPTQVPGSFGIVNHQYNGTQGYSLAFLPASNVKSLILYDDKNGITVAFANYNWSVGTKYWVRYRQEGNNHYVRIWADGAAEPTSWTFTATYSNGVPAGDKWAGVGTYTANGVIHYYKYAVATDGDTAVAEYEGNGYYNGYSNRKKITIDNTKIGTGVNEWIPILVKHTDPDLRSVANGGLVKKNPLIDIRFEDLYGAKMYHELTKYDETTGEIEAWVRTRVVSGGTNEFYIYFGKNLAQESVYGIPIGLGSADNFSIARNWYNGAFNPGEAQANGVNVKKVDGTVIDVGDGTIVAMAEDGTSYIGNNPLYSTGIDGYIMWTEQSTSARFGQDAGFNQKLIGVFRSGNQWIADRNGFFVAFTPVASDLLVAKARWNSGSDDTRRVDYIAPVFAGEEDSDGAWGDNVINYERYGFGTIGHQYRGVWHLNKLPRSGAMTYDQPEPTVFNTVMSGANMTSANSVAGKVGNGVSFNGSNTYMRSVKSSIVYSGGQYTTKGWFYFNSTSGNQLLVGRRDPVSGTSDPQSFMIWSLGGVINVDLAGSTARWNTGWSPAAGQWYHFAVVVEASATRLYINGNQVASVGVGGNPGTSASELMFGASAPLGNYFNGRLDEIRVSADRATAGRIKTEYNNQNSPSTFYSIGAIEYSAIPIVAASASHGHTVDSFTMTYNIFLAVQDAVNNTTSDSPVIVEHKTLTSNDATHGQTVDSITITQLHNIAVDGSIIGLDSTSPLLDEGDAVLPDSTTISVVSDNIALVQKHYLIVQNSSHEHKVDIIDLIEKQFLQVQGSSHSVTSEVIDLAQNFFLTPDSSIVGHISENIANIIDWTKLGVKFGIYKQDFKNAGNITSAELAEKILLKQRFGESGQFETNAVDEPGVYKPQYQQPGKF